MKTLIRLIPLVVIVIGCQNLTKQKENLIKKIINEELNSRYTGYEIVEIKPDSSFVYRAVNELRSLKLRVSSWNLDIIKSISDYEQGISKLTGKQTYLHIDSVSTEMENALTSFEDKRFLKSEPCYYVKYRIFKAENKVEKEEFFYIREYGDNQTEVITRPYNWDEFMAQEDYQGLLDDAVKYYRDILDYRYKYTGKY
jgi:hypothetical protein